MAPVPEARSRSFTLPLLLFTGICAGATWLALYVLDKPFMKFHVGILLYFGSITFLLHYWQERAVVNDPKGFVHRFMTGLVVKMFLSLILLVVLIFFLTQEQAIPIAIVFAFLYLAFLAFSTIRLSGILRKLPKP